ncbi:MAG TPA: hypothetical protein VLV83_05155 [Acidobacteriota bacterium]|nr:hypothetical protein [Acidobacteriota bacterium]
MTLQELNEKLSETRRQLALAEKNRRDLRDIRSQLGEELRRVERLEAEVRKESRDLDRLEGLSWTSLLADLKGDKMEKLEKEQKELLEARLRLEECSDGVAKLRARERELHKRSQSLGDPQTEYGQLLKQKRAMLKESGHPQFERLAALAEQRGKWEADRHELDEALTSGSRAVRALNRAHAMLDKAANWGTLDMLGGGLISGHMKHAKINEARQILYRARDALRLFKTELRDVQLQQEISDTPEIKVPGELVDLVFDNLLVDWMIQSKIRGVQTQIGLCSRRLKRVLNQLRKRRAWTDSQLRDLSQEARSVLEQAG